MTLVLSDIEARILGALVEKETTTPEYYPLSLNALVNACNQKSNRDPVMSLDEETVRRALRSLTDQAMVRSASGDSRVAKFEHRLNELYNFHRHEIAVLCVLLLRGPQTPGELHTRAERLYAFEDLDAVHAALNLLMRREPPLAKVLPRQPGTKESRYMHLLSQPVQIAGRNRIWRKMVIDGIRQDPDWKNGDYTTEPRAGLQIAADFLIIAGSAPLHMQEDFPTRDAAD